ncbi:hypothetical protein OAT10_00220 [Luminiphilus sp.]|nr:hypothetical protein [Luminiphilus sp.]
MTGKFRKKRQVELDPFQRKASESAKNSPGVGCTFTREGVPTYIDATGESFFESPRKTSRIVLGVDRPSNRLSGYGGRGDHGCGSVDIVAGPMSWVAQRTNITIREDDLGTAADYSLGGVKPRITAESLYADPHPILDAARVTITQMSNIDVEYGLDPGYQTSGFTFNSMKSKNQTDFNGRSYVLGKADGIRLISRDAGIRLITNTDTRNSQGGDISSVEGIQLIAGNKSTQGTKYEVQPMVKGRNLRRFLETIVNSINQICNIIDNMTIIQQNWNARLLTHSHVTTLPGTPTSLPFVMLPDGIKVQLDTIKKVIFPSVQKRINLAGLTKEYLQPVTGAEENYILSAFNYNN